MMISVLLLLFTSIYSIDSCFPSSPIVMPAPTPPPPPPPCQLCPLLKKDELVKQIRTIVNGCAVLTLTVTGVAGAAPNGVLTWDGGVIDVALPGSATLVAECNAGYIEWEYMGTPVTFASGSIY